MKPAKPIQLKSTKRDLRKFERNDFLLDFLSIDWGDFIHGKSSSEKLNIFISKTNSVIDSHAPLKSTWKKAYLPKNPWITQGLLKSISSENKLYRKFMKAKDPHLKKQKHANFKKTLKFALQTTKN